jgi:hypothetical protein
MVRAVTRSLPPALAEELLELVGEAGVITDPSRLLAYESDALTAFPPARSSSPRTPRRPPRSSER